MEKTAAIREIDATLRSRGFNYTGPAAADYEGVIKVHGKPISVTISVPDTRFVVKPRVFLKDRSEVPLATLAHIESDDGICYASGAGLPLDLHQPGASVLRVLDEAQRTLELSYRGRGKAEIVDEYQQYWSPKLAIQVMLPRSDSAVPVDAYTFFARRSDENLFKCLSSTVELAGYETSLPQEARIRFSRNKLGPGGGVRAPKTMGELKKWIEGQGEPPVLWETALDELSQGKSLFFAAPNVFLGIRAILPTDLAEGVKNGSVRRLSLPRILSSRLDRIEVDRYAGAWAGLDHVTMRNLNKGLSLKDISISIIGAGTIGGYLARLLVQSGAGFDGQLRIFDNQTLSEGNIGRHLLGFEYIGKPKASSLKSELERFHPQVKVAAYTDNAIDRWDLVRNSDIIIDATGEWNIQAALNDLFMAAGQGRPSALLHTWVFMNGAAVQSFLNLRDGQACFRCLKPKMEGPWRYPAGKERDELNLQPASCGDGSFVPFSVDAPVMAASLANRAVLDWISGKAGPRLRTAVVDLDRGRYQKPVSPSRMADCPACGGW
ncbi:Molybdopterin or thiamine biosynthesis adenylyltransferase [Agrobacterium fabrum]|uniref:Molybdopterin or thiamine biosynthesis adenylyltransferase n=1 Tax=Agrobacterium fabrum TaxID=1176649 RepID=A0A7Z7BS56_9HYPH|nr:ThiF family adenylyltransferase [Agrobacterium fabrum]SDK39408.1 Molybdopterin or thiamine biosynthesis adenylyltransferase [Agrobacterium fabrum]